MDQDIIKNRFDNSNHGRKQQPPTPRERTSNTPHVGQSIYEFRSRIVPLLPHQILEILTSHFQKKGYKYSVVAEVVSLKTDHRDFKIFCIYDFRRQVTKINIQDEDKTYVVEGYEDAISLIDK